jgi:OFA family oxalate/formate antiporter-like MFS transporter
MLVNSLCAVALIFAGGGFFMAAVCLAVICNAGPASIFPALTAELTGVKNMGANYGIVMLGLGFSSLVFNAISSLLVEATGGYTLSFVVTGLASAAAVGLMVFYNLAERKARRNKGLGEM